MNIWRILPNSMIGRLVAVVACAILPAIALHAWHAETQYRQSLDDAGTELELHAEDLARRFDQTLRSATQALTSINEIASRHWDSPSTCRDRLREVIPAFAQFVDFGVADLDGRIFCDSSHRPLPINVGDRDYFEYVRKHEAITVGRFTVSRLSGEPVIPVAGPILDAQHQLRGVARVTIDSGWLHELLETGALPAGYVAMLIDSHGTIVARTPENHEWVGKTIGTRQPAEHATSSPRTTRIAHDVDGTEMLFGDAVSGGVRWLPSYRVLVGVPTEQVVAVARRSLLEDLTVVTVSGFLALMLGYTLGFRFIVRHLYAVRSRLNAIGTGRASSPLQRDAARGELADLIEGVEAMAARLAEKDAATQRATDAVVERETLLREFLDNYSALAFAKDLSGRYILVNHAFASMLGRPPEAIIGATDEALFGKVQAEAFAANDKITLDQGTTRVCDERVELADGTHIFVSVKFPLRDQRGKIYAIAAVSTDVTERNQLASQREQLMRDLAQRNRELQDFAYISSHDLQEPLRKIETFGDRLLSTQGERLDERGRDYLARMQNAASRMSQLIRALLSYSRVETHAQAPSVVDLNTVLEGVLGDLEVPIAESGATIDVTPLPRICADESQMRQLLQNLISNALKFRRADVPPALRIWAEPSGEAAHTLITLHIEDNGIGFDEKYLDKVFAPFQRLHGRDAYPGSGIGLAVCRKIAERHGGTISARSTPGKGATFSVTLSKSMQFQEPS